MILAMTLTELDPESIDGLKSRLNGVADELYELQVLAKALELRHSSRNEGAVAAEISRIQHAIGTALQTLTGNGLNE